jgi:hypothetical protein
MRTKTINLIINCLLGCILASGTAWAQRIEGPDAPNATGRLESAISVAGQYQNYIYGVVRKITKGELILDKTRFGNDQVFKLEHKTKFIANGKRSTLAELKKGEMVWVDAKINKKTSKKVARKVITGVGPEPVS